MELIRVHADEIDFNAGFGSFESQCDQRELDQLLESQKLTFEVYHNDRVKVDVKIGQVEMNFSEIKACEFKKTKFSYVRILDAFYAIYDSHDFEEKRNKIGELRVKIYLEDLGPVDLIALNELKVGQEIDSKNIMANLQIEDQLKGINPNMGQGDIHDLQTSLEELEMKVVWELENWKKVEESKFLFGLKQREMDFLVKISEEWKKKEMEKDKMFRNYELSLGNIENKLKTKAMELQKREGKIILLETEFRTKVEESSREVSKKNEEIKGVKNEQIEISKRHANYVKNSEKQIGNLNNNLAEKDKEFQNLKREIENSNVAKL